jgi:membrane-bound lytic murein transglycosylase F
MRAFYRPSAIISPFVVGLLLISSCTENGKNTPPRVEEQGKERGDGVGENEIPRVEVEKKGPGPRAVEEEKDRLRKIRERGEITVLTKANGHCFYTYRGEAMGFEYDLARAFADYLGVSLKVNTPPWEEMIESLRRGEGDFIAANMTVMARKEDRIDFSNGYLSVDLRVVLHKDNHTVEKMEDLSGKTIHVTMGSPYEDRLYALQREGVDFKIARHYGTPLEDLIRRVARKQIELTVADSNVALLNRRYYPDIRIGIPVAHQQIVAWAVEKGESALLAEINAFFDTIKNDGTFKGIYKAYYNDVETFDRFDVRKYHERIRTKLPEYEAIIKKAAEKYGFDWRLITAIIYQESHFDPQAKSHRGALGLMQLTRLTAEEMGVTDRLDPEQSISGGVKYLRRLYRSYDKAEGLDRLLITLASYNVGPRHITNAQRIARKRGLAPHKWSSLEETLPLLCYEKYVQNDEFGYCRGAEPVRYVDRVLLYFDILRGQHLSEMASRDKTRGMDETGPRAN